MTKRHSFSIDEVKPLYSKKIKIFFLLLPQLVLTFILVLGVLQALIQSLGYIPALNLNDITLSYYRDTLSDPKIQNSILFSLFLAFISATLSVLIGLLICYLFVNQKKHPSWVERIIQVPIIIPHLVVALFIIQFFSQTGIIARLLYALGVDNAQQMMSSFLYQSNGIGIILAYLWKEIPFVIFFVFSLIRQVNNSLGEAAQTLGATRFQAFTRVTLPLCRKTIIIAYFIIFLFAFGSYELPAILGPTLPLSLPEAAYIEYTHPDLLNRPYAMAVNGWILIISLVITGLIALVFIYPNIQRRDQGERHEI